MPPPPVPAAAVAAALPELWSPRIVAALNDEHVKVARVHGAFVWHAHDATDELFLVLDGRLRIDFEDGAADLGPGELLVVPRGVRHRPVAAEPCCLLLVERAGTVNTGDAGGALTARGDTWA